MKKLLSIFLSVVLLVLTSCKPADDKTVTGDVKDKAPAAEVDNVEPQPEQEKEKEPQVSDGVPEENGPEIEKNAVTLAAEALGVVFGEGGELEEDAGVFAHAIAAADREKVAEYTQGKPEYYSFLDNVVINGYDIYPVYVPDEMVAEKDREGKFFRGYDMYLIDFDVRTGDGKHFKEGSNVYYLGLGYDAVSGGPVNAFVPYSEAEEHIYYDSSNDSDVKTWIIREFLSLYPNENYGTRLYEGKNYPEDFDFSGHVHLVTHLMARNGIYGGEPPYTLDEINSFLGDVFNGNEGISPDNAGAHEYWTSGIGYGVTDEDRAEGRIYGCSWGHGGTTVEHSVVSVEKDGNREIHTVQLYADYCHFAQSRLVEITFENAENDIPNMILVNVIEDTGAASALVSV